MGVGGHLSTFAGKKVVEFESITCHDPGDVIFRIRVDWDDRLDWVDKFNDLQPIFEGKKYPKLTCLRLRNAEITDEIARAMADAPILDQLETLDLSMGTLGNESAQALYESPRIQNLKRLNLNNHYCSDEMVKKNGRPAPKCGDGLPRICI